MLMHISVLYNFSFKYINNRSSYICNSMVRRIRLYRGQLYLNVVKIMPFILDV